MKNRIKNLIIFILVFLIEIIIAVFIHDKFIRPYIGDILVIILIYFFIKSIKDEIKYLPIYVFLFSVLIEIGQYFNMVKVLGVENIRFFRVLLGSTFDWRDIICYGVGCTVLLFYERIKNK